MDLNKIVSTIRMITFTAILLALSSVNTFAGPLPASYVLLFDRLYDYHSNTSDVLRQYVEIKSTGAEVLLLPVDKLDTGKIDKNATIITFASSFESIDKYHQVLTDLKDFQVKPYNGYIVSPGQKTKNPGLLIAINEVYPFSDLNKLMDLAETLNNKGIEYIVSVMPVYDNYEFEAR